MVGLGNESDLAGTSEPISALSARRSSPGAPRCGPSRRRRADASSQRPARYPPETDILSTRNSMNRLAEGKLPNVVQLVGTIKKDNTGQALTGRTITRPSLSQATELPTVSARCLQVNQIPPTFPITLTSNQINPELSDNVRQHCITLILLNKLTAFSGHYPIRDCTRQAEF